MKPTIGRIVLYSTTEKDQRMINEHVTDTPHETAPAIIVFVSDDQDLVNLKVLVDGYRDLYVKGVSEGDQPGQYQWPQILTTQAFVQPETDENVNAFILDSLQTPVDSESKIETPEAGEQETGGQPGDGDKPAESQETSSPVKETNPAKAKTK